MHLPLLINLSAVLPAVGFTSHVPSSGISSRLWSSSSSSARDGPTHEELNDEQLKQLAELAASAPPVPFAVNIAYDVKPNRRDEFLQVMKNNDLEPKAIQSVVGQDVDDANKFYVHQQFASKDDYNNPTTYMEKFGIDFFQSDPFGRFPVSDDFELCHDGHDEKVANVEGTVCLNVQLCIKDEHREEFVEVIQNNKAGSDKEALCMQYSWGESVSTFGRFHFHEQYVSEQGLVEHTEGDHFAVWEKFAAKEDSPFERPPIVQKFVIV